MITEISEKMESDFTEVLSVSDLIKICLRHGFVLMGPFLYSKT